MTFEEFLQSVDKPRLIAALEAVTLHGNRSSLNDIGGRAKALAKQFCEEQEDA